MKLPLPLIVVTTLLLILTESQSAQQNLASSVRLANFVSKRLHRHFNTTTSFRTLKEEYEKVDFSFKKWDIPSLIADIARDMEAKFTRATKCLSDLRTRVQQLYKKEYQEANGNYEAENYIVSYLDTASGKSKKSMSYSLQHDQNVSFTETVFSTPADVSINGTKVETDIIWTKGLRGTFTDNFKKESELLIWQYFCTENGVLRLYPAPADFPRKTVDYDCRFQPWFIDGDGCSKDIIIAFDLSGSMVGWPLTLAQKTASQILKLMSDNDFLGFIGISSQPTYLTDSHNNSITLLNRATDRIKHEINMRIQDVRPDDEANFDKAVEAAFDMFNNSANTNRSAQCQKVLIVFSDGTIQNCKETFERRNPNQDVQVFTFACGNPRTTTSGLREMACNNRGNFLEMGHLSDVNANTFKFFNMINKNSNSGRGNFTPKWSNAYMEAAWKTEKDEWSPGSFEETNKLEEQMILSVSAPSYYQEKKTGIVGLDIKISNLVSKVANLSKVGLYAIILNNRGNLVYHPRLKPLSELERTYTARFAEVELCKGDISSSDIERAIISGESGVVQGNCLYHYSFSLERGRELYTKMQYHYTPVKTFPFFLALAIPTAFSNEIESSKNLTDVIPILRRILANPGSSLVEDTPLSPQISISITGWFKQLGDTPKETVRFNTYVMNETAAHYSVVSDIVRKAWPAQSTDIVPVMLYTNAGLLLYNLKGWLEVEENSQIFTENERLIASLDADDRLTMGPKRRSSAYREQDVFFLTRNIILQQDSTAITPAIVGTEFYKLSLLEIFKLGKVSYREPPVQTYLLDDKGFINSIEPVNDIEMMVDQHLTAVFPELMDQMLNRSVYTRDSYKNCLQTCKNKTKPASSATSLSNTLLLLYNTITLSTSHSQLGSTISLKRQDSFYRCCKDYFVYKLNHKSAAGVHTLACATCDKTLHAAPVKGTNLLLLNDLSPDCTCSSVTPSNQLAPRNTTSVFNVSFGELSYSPLPCTNNLNISTLCSGAQRGLVSLVWGAFLLFHVLT